MRHTMLANAKSLIVLVLALPPLRRAGLGAGDSR